MFIPDCQGRRPDARNRPFSSVLCGFIEILTHLSIKTTNEIGPHRQVGLSVWLSRSNESLCVVPFPASIPHRLCGMASGSGANALVCVVLADRELLFRMATQLPTNPLVHMRSKEDNTDVCIPYSPQPRGSNILLSNKWKLIITIP